MYELTRQFIQKNLDNERIPWTDRQREMLSGMSAYTETATDEFEGAYKGMTNPGKPPEPITELPEDPDEQPEGDD